MRINHNIAALNTHRQLLKADLQLTKSLEKLSSGYQINRAADDAAGLSISQRLRAQIAGLKVASKNADQAKNLIQTAEGALNEIHGMLTRMRELAVQSASDSVDTSNREALDAEFANLATEIDRISDSLEYNGITLLDGNFTGTFQIGPNGDPDNTIEIVIAGVKTENLAIDDDDLLSRINAVTAITSIDLAIDAVSETRSDIGAIQNRLAYTVTSVDIAAENLQASESSIRDLDISDEITEFTRSQIMSQAATAILAQANAVPQNVLALFR